MTSAWKRQVLHRLDENKRTDTEPRNQSELANLVGVSKSAIGKMLWEPSGTHGEPVRKMVQVVSALVDRISTVLGIPLPFVASIATAPQRPPTTEPAKAPVNIVEQSDELDEAVRWIPQEHRARAAAILRAAFGHIRKNHDH